MKVEMGDSVPMWDRDELMLCLSSEILLDLQFSLVNRFWTARNLKDVMEEYACED